MNMRKFLVLAAIAFGTITSAPAAGQSLDGLIRVIGGGRGISDAIGRNCSGGGMSQFSCQARRLDSVSRQFDTQRRQMESRRRQREQQYSRVNQALQRACKLGDRESCDRAGPALDQKQTQLQQALRQACDAGDRRSCSRIGARSMSRDTYAYRDDYADRSDYRARDEYGY